MRRWAGPRGWAAGLGVAPEDLNVLDVGNDVCCCGWGPTAEASINAFTIIPIGIAIVITYCYQVSVVIISFILHY